MSSRILMRLLFLIAAIAVVIGIIVLLVTFSQPVSFGWFAYSPLSATTYNSPGVHVISTAGVVGTVVLVAGLIALAFWAGLRIGGRHKPKDEHL